MLKDKDIREALFEFLEREYGKIRIFEEKNMGNSRADVVMITEKNIYGIEIKSDADTYARLGRQIKDYNRFFDYNYAVVGTTHAMHIEEHVPSFWGIITVEEVDGEIDFYVLRRPQINPFMEWKLKLGMLWRPELVHIQEINDMPAYKNRSKDFVIEKILLKVDKNKLDTQICNELFERDYSTIAEQIHSYRLEQAAKQSKRVRRKSGKRMMLKSVRKKRK